MIKLLFSKLFGKSASCEEVDGFLTEYLEGTLDDNTVKKFESHIALCPMCVDYLEQFKLAIEVTSKDTVVVPPELVEQTVSFLSQHLD